MTLIYDRRRGDTAVLKIFFCEVHLMLNEEKQMRPQSRLIASVFLVGLVMPAMAQRSTDTQNAAYEVEEIYVARSIRISTTVPPTTFCNNAHFKGGRIIEANFTWSS